MPLRDALQFISEIRQNEELKESVRSMEPETDLQEIVRAGLEAGFVFTADELRSAYRHDWTLRWLHERVNLDQIIEGFR